MKSIVDGYVRLANRTALEGLIAHHRQLLKELDAQAKASEADLTAPMVKVDRGGDGDHRSRSGKAGGEIGRTSQASRKQVG